MSYFNPNNPTYLPINVTTTYPPTPPVDALTRIAAAMERIAFQLEQYNQKQSVTVTPAPKPVRKKVTKKRG